MNRRFSVVTTFNQSGYDIYGSRMIDTFLKNWPQDILLWVYAEDCGVQQRHPRLHVLDFHATVPALVAFKQRWGNDLRASGRQVTSEFKPQEARDGYAFRWDAVRFSHKVYAVCHHARNHAGDVMLWMDADTICHSEITMPALENLVPQSADICFLGRAGKYTECGLYALNLGSQRTQAFLDRFLWVYEHAEQGIFTMAEWHDSFVFDRVREQFDLVEHDWSAGLIKGEGHPLINSQWGAYLDHLKGKRKQTGRSADKDLLIPRSESYWTASA